VSELVNKYCKTSPTPNGNRRCLLKQLTTMAYMVQICHQKSQNTCKPFTAWQNIQGLCTHHLLSYSRCHVILIRLVHCAHGLPRTVHSRKSLFSAVTKKDHFYPPFLLHSNTATRTLILTRMWHNKPLTPGLYNLGHNVILTVFCWP